MAKKRLTDDQVKALLAQINAGADPKKVTSENGISLTTYYNWVKKHEGGVKVSKAGRPAKKSATTTNVASPQSSEDNKAAAPQSAPKAKAATKAAPKVKPAAQAKRGRSAKFTTTQIKTYLAQVDGGTKVDDILKDAGISLGTYYNWRKQYGKKKTKASAVKVAKATPVAPAAPAAPATTGAKAPKGRPATKKVAAKAAPALKAAPAPKAAPVAKTKAAKNVAPKSLLKMDASELRKEVRSLRALVDKLREVLG